MERLAAATTRSLERRKRIVTELLGKNGMEEPDSRIRRMQKVPKGCF